MRRAARQFVRTLKGTHVNRQAGGAITLGAEGAEKVVSGFRWPADFDSVAAVDRAGDSRGGFARQTRSAEHQGDAYAAARIGGNLHRVRLLVQESDSGKFVYDSYYQPR